MLPRVMLPKWSSTTEGVLSAIATSKVGPLHCNNGKVADETHILPTAPPTAKSLPNKQRLESSDKRVLKAGAKEDEMRELLHSAGLPTSGRKGQLRKRLLEEAGFVDEARICMKKSRRSKQSDKECKQREDDIESSGETDEDWS